LFLDYITEPTHVMDEFGKLASNLANANFYRERDIRNPFRQNILSIAEATAIAQKATEEMGVWQEHDCTDMRWLLTRMDSDGDGRLPLEDVYDAGPTESDEHGEQIFRVSESQDYLREIGALDESVAEKPQLLISNYVVGPANCYKSNALHTYCCPNACDRVLGTMERAANGPTAKPDILVAAVSGLRNTSIMMNEQQQQQQQLPDNLVKKLVDIASRHGNAVPLHGRLFAQWLHFAFPHECPYPHAAHRDAFSNTLMTSFFNPLASRPASARTVAKENPLMQWTDDEDLPLAEDADAGKSDRSRSTFRVVFMALAVGALFKQLWDFASSGKVTFQTEVWGRDLDKLV